MGSVSKTARKVMGWFSSILRSVTCGLASGLQASALELLEDDRLTMASATSLQDLRRGSAS